MLVCHCFRITSEEMESLIRGEGLSTVDEVSEHTGACRGCMTCYIDILAILDRVAAERTGPGS